MLLISMPLGALERPALGISILKACLADIDVECNIRYLSFPFAEMIGYDEYRWLTYDLPYTAFAGDWSFAHALYGEDPALDQCYVREVLRRTWRFDDSTFQRVLRVRALVSPFLDHCLAAIPWHEYAIVGFTSTFEQNIASLALARWVKASHPGAVIVFGGANWEGEMGLELHRQFSFVDYVCSGEAERSFPALVQRMLAEAPIGCGKDGIPGVVLRDGHDSVCTGPPSLVRDLDTLPIPDFSDYFHELSQSTIGASIVPTLLLETSRGCWWGAKSQCTFCGLNGEAITFRSKSAGRALDELRLLTELWKTDLVEVVDNVLDMEYFRGFIPDLAEARLPVRLFYEVRAHLTRGQVKDLRDAGVTRVQAGIESLSNHVLKLMRKGTTALDNIQLLKWCKEFGVSADWNLLYGFPGETHADYAGTVELLTSIRFLGPPSACGPIRLDRFSPYFLSPASFGIVNLRPIHAYRFLYRFGEPSLSRIAYYFDFDYRPDVNPDGSAREVIDYVAEWQRIPEKGTLLSVLRPDGSLLLLDSRACATGSQVLLTGPEAAAYLYCDRHRSAAAVEDYLRKHFPEIRPPGEGVRSFLESLVANRLMVTDGTRYLSLAVTGTAVVPDAQPQVGALAPGTHGALDLADLALSQSPLQAAQRRS